MRTTEEEMNPNARLSFIERFAYGVGDYAGNLVYSAISAFLLVYYTNVVGASAAAAASIIAFSKILDGIPDLAMGYIVDHTNSKWGKSAPMDCKTLHSACSMYCPDVQCADKPSWESAACLYVSYIQSCFYCFLHRNQCSLRNDARAYDNKPV